MVAMATQPISGDSTSRSAGMIITSTRSSAIDADLGQQAAKQRRRHDLRRVIGGRQPEIDREAAAFMPKATR